MTSKEVVARFGVARRALDRARLRGIVLAVASQEGGAKPTYWYEPASIAAWVAKWRKPSEPTATAPEVTS